MVRECLGWIGVEGKMGYWITKVIERNSGEFITPRELHTKYGNLRKFLSGKEAADIDWIRRLEGRGDVFPVNENNGLSSIVYLETTWDSEEGLKSLKIHVTYDSGIYIDMISEIERALSMGSKGQMTIK